MACCYSEGVCQNGNASQTKRKKVKMKTNSKAKANEMTSVETPTPSVETPIKYAKRDFLAKKTEKTSTKEKLWSLGNYTIKGFVESDLYFLQRSPCLSLYDKKHSLQPRGDRGTSQEEAENLISALSFYHGLSDLQIMLGKPDESDAKELAKKKLEVYENEKLTEEEKKVALEKLKTVSAWIKPLPLEPLTEEAE